MVHQRQSPLVLDSKNKTKQNKTKKQNKNNKKPNGVHWRGYQAITRREKERGRERGRGPSLCLRLLCCFFLWFLLLSGAVLWGVLLFLCCVIALISITIFTIFTIFTITTIILAIIIITLVITIILAIHTFIVVFVASCVLRLGRTTVYIIVGVPVTLSAVSIVNVVGVGVIALLCFTICSLVTSIVTIVTIVTIITITVIIWCGRGFLWRVVRRAAL